MSLSPEGVYVPGLAGYPAGPRDGMIMSDLRAEADPSPIVPAVADHGRAVRTAWYSSGLCRRRDTTRRSCVVPAVVRCGTIAPVTTSNDDWIGVGGIDSRSKP